MSQTPSDDSAAPPVTGTTRVKRGMAEQLKGGVIMDVVTPDQAKIAEDAGAVAVMALERVPADIRAQGRSEEHTSELQSRQYLVCRLLLEKKKKKNSLIYLSRCLT